MRLILQMSVPMLTGNGNARGILSKTWSYRCCLVNLSHSGATHVGLHLQRHEGNCIHRIVLSKGFSPQSFLSDIKARPHYAKTPDETNFRVH